MLGQHPLHSQPRRQLVGGPVTVPTDVLELEWGVSPPG